MTSSQSVTSTNGVTSSSSTTASGIAVLPQHIVDQIAAGEVVQRPVSVVKELLENCLDAGSTNIQIQIEKGGQKITIIDNGCGIPKHDLALAATRHATSKYGAKTETPVDSGDTDASKNQLPANESKQKGSEADAKVQTLLQTDTKSPTAKENVHSTTNTAKQPATASHDQKTSQEDPTKTSAEPKPRNISELDTFGFRGEALASISMVSRITITSKTKSDRIAYMQSYLNGKPQTTTLKRAARSSAGTTIVVQDLFYNVPHRLKLYSKSTSEEYNRILQVVQAYAIHYPHVGFVCQKNGTTKSGGILVDLNTTNLPMVRKLLQRQRQVTQSSKSNSSKSNTDTGSHQQAKSQQLQLLLSQNDDSPKTTDSDDSSIQKHLQTATKQVMAHIFASNLEPHIHHAAIKYKNTHVQHHEEDSDDDNDGKDYTKYAANKKVTKKKKNGDPDTIFQFECQYFITAPSCTITKERSTKFVLFVNDRLVDCLPLKRSVEDVYLSFCKTNHRPILVFRITVPPNQIDVNVHPSKRQVAFMYQDELCLEIGIHVQKFLSSLGQTFERNAIRELPSSSSLKQNTISNPYASTKKRKLVEEKKTGEHSPSSTTIADSSTSPTKMARRESIAASPAASTPNSQPANSSQGPSSVIHNPYAKVSPFQRARAAPSHLIRTSRATPVGAIEPFLVPTQPQQPTQATTVSTQSTLPATSSPLSPIIPSRSQSPMPMPTKLNFTTKVHFPECPWSKQRSQQQQHPSSSSNMNDVLSPLSPVDLTQPGAFVDALKCSCPDDDQVLQLRVRKRAGIVRPKRVIPTKCTYSSVSSLRALVNKQKCPELTQHLKDGYFVGVLSAQCRSLIQCGENLALINHHEMAKELFYQLSLARFGGGATIAQLSQDGSGGIDIQSIIAQALELEDQIVIVEENQFKDRAGSSQHSIDGEVDYSSLLRDGVSVGVDKSDESEDSQNSHGSRSDGVDLLPVGEMNNKLAEQATACLLGNAQMLEEYFGIRIKQQSGENQDGTDSQRSEQSGSSNSEDAAKDKIVLTGLPVLMDGHMPPPHGLAIFLFRLATQVDWAEEKLCFEGICRELAAFYGSIPREDPESYIQHVLFPAISYLLIPTQRLAKDGNFTMLTRLSKLYRVFERC